MNISHNSVVSFHYQLHDGDGNAIEDSTKGGQPMLYLHGHHNIFPALEAALEGKQKGDKVSATLTPDQTYGERRDDAVQRVSFKHLIGHSKSTHYKPGMKVQLNTSEGPVDVVVLKVGLKTLDVDINHPFAGKTLKFDIEIVDVRAASPEEVAHGHAHGIGGHQH